MLLATLLAVAAPTTPQQAIAQLNHDACVKGEVRLPRDHVQVLEDNPVPGPAGRVLGYALPLQKASYLRVLQPANTYLVMLTFSPTKGRNLVSSCTILTRALTGREANVDFRATSPSRMPLRVHGTNLWEFDFPRLGYRKRFYFTSDGWAYFTTEVYGRSNQAAAR